MDDRRGQEGRPGCGEVNVPVFPHLGEEGVQKVRYVDVPRFDPVKAKEVEENKVWWPKPERFT